MHRVISLCIPIVLVATLAAAKSPVPPAVLRGDDPLLAPWQKATVRAVDDDDKRHSMHTYYLTSPESPDGCWVLFFTSTTADGQKGEIRVRDRVRGDERIIARGLIAEDAHRVACQQWISNGRRIA